LRANKTVLRLRYDFLKKKLVVKKLRKNRKIDFFLNFKFFTFF
jgi:hypothetical protein